MPKHCPRTHRETVKHYNKRLSLGLATIHLIGPARLRRFTRGDVARLYNDDDPRDKVNGDSSKYWVKKVLDPTFHNGKHGGRREGTFKLTSDEGALVEVTVMHGFRRRPDRNLCSVAAAITRLINTTLRPATNATRARLGLPLYPGAVDFTRRDIYTLFAKWGWKAKVPIRIHLHKFRPDNIMRYINYAVAVTWIEPARLKYLDEATYCARGS